MPKITTQGVLELCDRVYGCDLVHPVSVTRIVRCGPYGLG